MGTKKFRGIDPDAWYGLKDITDMGVLDHFRSSLPGVRSLVKADKANDNLLNAVVIGEGNARRYRIKGRNLIDFIVNLEEGGYRL